MPPAPLIIPGASSVGTGFTRTQYRRALAEQVGEITVLQVVALASAAVNPDANRQILATPLGADGVALSHFDDAYVYVANGTEARAVRKVTSGTYEGAINSLLVDRPYDSGPLAINTEVELTRPFGGDRHLTTKGLNQLVDEALARIWIDVRVSLTGDGDDALSLNAYPWFQRYEQGLGLYDTRWGDPTASPELSPYGYRLVANGGDRTLVSELAYASADTFQLAAIVKADRYVYNGSSWGFATTTPGLRTDDYQAAAPIEWVVTIGVVKALQERRKQVRMDRMMDRAERAQALAEIERDMRIWAPAAYRIKTIEMPRALPERMEALVGVEPSASWI